VDFFECEKGLERKELRGVVEDKLLINDCT
jgi:hypothetical protein